MAAVAALEYIDVEVDMVANLGEFAEPTVVAEFVQDTLVDAVLDLIAAQQFDTATAVEADVEIGTGVNLGGQGTVVV